MKSWCLITQSCHNAFWSDSVLCCLYNTGEHSFEVKTGAISNDVTEHYKPECSRQFTMKKSTKMHRKSYKGEKWHSCSQCEKRYSAPSTLSHHMNIHRGRHKCTECGRCCQSSQHLAEHRRCHSGEKPYSCGECEKRFTSSTGLCIHMNIHRGKYKCTECGRCCGSKRDLALHRRCHSGEKPFECGECEKRFTSSRSMCHHHMNIHIGKFKCTECGRCCQSSQQLAKHQETHSGEKPYLCGVCEKRFLSPSTLCSHMNIHRGKYKCTECGRCCRSKEDLSVHRRRHSGEEPYSCGECEKRFSSRSGLCLHMNIHSEKFKCTECGRCCHSSQHLEEHSRIHSRDKLYSCTQCEERFPYLSELSKHMNIHRYMPQYACTECGKCFADRADIAEHRRNNLAGNCLKVMFLMRDHSYARRSQC